jgi:hypothetical protein
MAKRTWTPEQLFILMQGRKEGRSFATIAQELKMSKNQVASYYAWCLKRHTTWNWEEIKRVAHGT